MESSKYEPYVPKRQRRVPWWLALSCSVVAFIALGILGIIFWLFFRDGGWRDDNSDAKYVIIIVICGGAGISLFPPLFSYLPGFVEGADQSIFTSLCAPARVQLHCFSSSSFSSVCIASYAVLSAGKGESGSAT